VTFNDYYRDRGVVPVGRRSRRNKLRKLASYDLIKAEGEGAGRRYQVLDASIASPVDVNLQIGR
jgi:hypothetical protein